MKGALRMGGLTKAQILANLRSQVRLACARASTLTRSLSDAPSAEVTESKLKEARQQARSARAALRNDSSSARLAQILDQMDRRREELTLDLTEARSKLESIRQTKLALDRALANASAIENANGSSETQLSRALEQLNHAQSAATRVAPGASQLASKFDRNLHELLLWGQEFAQGPKTGGASSKGPPTETPDQVQKRLVREAEVVQLRATVEKFAVEPEGGWQGARPWLTSTKAIDELQQSLTEARQSLDSGDTSKAIAALANAESQRAKIFEEVATNQEAKTRALEVAEAVMQALHDRNYNLPKSGPINPNDPLSGIRVRADVPNRDGRGNVRVDILLDGRTDIDVENVPTGQEHICRGLVEGLSEALVEDGMSLEVTDWGRNHQPATAGQLSDPPPPDRERERQRTR